MNHMEAIGIANNLVSADSIGNAPNSAANEMFHSLFSLLIQHVYPPQSVKYAINFKAITCNTFANRIYKGLPANVPIAGTKSTVNVQQDTMVVCAGVNCDFQLDAVENRHTCGVCGVMMCAICVSKSTGEEGFGSKGKCRKCVI